jgi:predicted nucleic acid-binding protein
LARAGGSGVLLDSGILYAFYDRRDAWHRAARDLITRERGRLIVPAPVIPEVDHLLAQRLGVDAQILFYRSLTENRYFLVDLPPAGYVRVHELNRRYRDLGLGFVDAAVLALAELLGVNRIATTDRRDFEVVRIALPIELLPS